MKSDFLKKGIAHYNDAEYEALKSFNKALDENKENPEAWLYLGKIHVRYERHKKAETALKNAIAFNPENPEGWSTFADYYLNLKDKGKNALKCIEKALELSPDNRHYLEQKGDILMYLKENTKAVECYDKMFEVCDGAYEKYVAYSRVAYFLQEYHNLNDKALEYYNKAIEILSSVSDERINNLESKEGIYSSVFRLLKKMNKTEEVYSFIDTWIKSGNVRKRSFADDIIPFYKEQKEHDKVLNSYDIQIKTPDPGHTYIESSFIFNKALYAHQNGFMDIALQGYEDLIEHTQAGDRFRPYSCLNKAIILNSKGESQKTIEFLNSVPEYENLNKDLVIAKAHAHYLSGNYISTLELCDKALGFDSDYDLAIYYKASSFLCLERYTEAYPAILRTLQVNPQFLEYFQESFSDVKDEKIQQLLRDGKPHYSIELERTGKNPYELKRALKQYPEAESKKRLLQYLKDYNKPESWTFWELQLEHAFDVLLKKPVSKFDPDKQYLLYFWADQEVFEEEVSLDELEKPSLFEGAGKYDSGEKQLFVTRYKSDLNQSVFEFSPEDFDEDLPASLADICKKSEYSYTVAGNRLAAHVREKGLDLEEICGYARIWRRVVTDGSLFNAMQTATYTMGGEDSMLTADLIEDPDLVEVKEEWKQLLQEVENEKLQYHLLLLCQTHQASRCVGFEYRGKDDNLELRNDEAEVLAVWRAGEGQLETVLLEMK